MEKAKQQKVVKIGIQAAVAAVSVAVQVIGILGLCYINSWIDSPFYGYLDGVRLLWKYVICALTIASGIIMLTVLSMTLKGLLKRIVSIGVTVWSSVLTLPLVYTFVGSFFGAKGIELPMVTEIVVEIQEIFGPVWLEYMIFVGGLIVSIVCFAVPIVTTVLTVKADKKAESAKKAEAEQIMTDGTNATEMQEPTETAEVSVVEQEESVTISDIQVAPVDAVKDEAEQSVVTTVAEEVNAEPIAEEAKAEAVAEEVKAEAVAEDAKEEIVAETVSIPEIAVETAKKPAAKKPAAKKTDSATSTAKKPTAKKPAAKKTDSTTGTAAKPAAKKPAVKKADSTTGTAAKPAAKKPAAKKVEKPEDAAK